MFVFVLLNETTRHDHDHCCLDVVSSCEKVRGTKMGWWEGLFWSNFLRRKMVFHQCYDTSWWKWREFFQRKEVEWKEWVWVWREEEFCCGRRGGVEVLQGIDRWSCLLCRLLLLVLLIPLLLILLLHLLFLIPPYIHLLPPLSSSTSTRWMRHRRETNP